MEVIKKFENIDEMDREQQIAFFNNAVEYDNEMLFEIFLDHCRNSSHFFAKLDEYGEFEDWCMG